MIYSHEYVNAVVENFVSNGIDTAEEWEELHSVCTSVDPDMRGALYSELQPCFTMQGSLDYLFSIVSTDDYEEVSSTDTPPYSWAVTD